MTTRKNPVASGIRTPGASALEADTLTTKSSEAVSRRGTSSGPKERGRGTGGRGGGGLMVVMSRDQPPGASALKADALTTKPSEAVSRRGTSSGPKERGRGRRETGREGG